MDSKQFMIPKTSTLSRRKVIMIRIVLLILFVVWVAGAIYLYLDVRESSKKLREIKKEAQDEFDKIKKTKKLYQAYEPALNETRSTVDIKDEEA